MAKVYDTTFREMFGKGLPALLPWLLPDVKSCEVLPEDKVLATTSRFPDLVLRVAAVRPERSRHAQDAAGAGRALRDPALVSPTSP